MPLPLLLIAGAIISGSTGVGLGIKGGAKMSSAKNKLKKAQSRHDSNTKRLERMNRIACTDMDILGKNELEALSSFKTFSDLFAKIRNRPEFKDIKIGSIDIPKFEAKEINKVSAGASILVGGLGAAALGTAGGFAASGATTSAVMALGAASTGIEISALSGAAATNATLAAIGGGSLAAGGGGMAAGTAILGGATLGVGLLVGGIIFNYTGSKLSDKADEAWSTMIENERNINKICTFLSELTEAAQKYNLTFSKVRRLYNIELGKMKQTIASMDRGMGINWKEMSLAQQKNVENVVMFVNLLYNMCKVKIVKSSKLNSSKVNHYDIEKSIDDTETVLKNKWNN